MEKCFITSTTVPSGSLADSISRSQIRAQNNLAIKAIYGTKKVNH